MAGQKIALCAISCADLIQRISLDCRITFNGGPGKTSCSPRRSISAPPSARRGNACRAIFIGRSRSARMAVLTLPWRGVIYLTTEHSECKPHRGQADADVMVVTPEMERVGTDRLCDLLQAGTSSAYVASEVYRAMEAARAAEANPSLLRDFDPASSDSEARKAIS